MPWPSCCWVTVLNSVAAGENGVKVVRARRGERVNRKIYIAKQINMCAPMLGSYLFVVAVVVVVAAADGNGDGKILRWCCLFAEQCEKRTATVCITHGWMGVRGGQEQTELHARRRARDKRQEGTAEGVGAERERVIERRAGCEKDRRVGNPTMLVHCCLLTTINWKQKRIYSWMGEKLKMCGVPTLRVYISVLYI